MLAVLIQEILSPILAALAVALIIFMLPVPMELQTRVVIAIVSAIFVVAGWFTRILVDVVREERKNRENKG